jgi:Leucine-rich repeat (LRR) protein
MVLAPEDPKVAEYYTLPQNNTGIPSSSSLYDWTLIHLIVQPPPTTFLTSNAPPQEMNALKVLYSALSGPKWNATLRWMTGDPCTNNWSGVHCRLGHIAELKLPNNNLVGRIPSALSALRWLSVLDLSNNKITGFSTNLTLPGLRILRMGNNQLTTAPVFHNSYCLTTMALPHNLLTSLPLGVGTLPFLSYIDLSHNVIRAQVPLFVNTSSLSVLRMAHNKLYGPFPSTLARQVSLREVDLSYNSLNSTIPMDLMGLCNLQILQLQYNGLYGNLLPRMAACPAFGRTLNWDVSYNRLTFLAPHALFEDTKYVNLEGNNFLCPIPTEWRLPYSARILCDARH